MPHIGYSSVTMDAVHGYSMWKTTAVVTEEQNAGRNSADTLAGVAAPHHKKITVAQHRSAAIPKQRLGKCGINIFIRLSHVVCGRGQCDRQYNMSYNRIDVVE